MRTLVALSVATAVVLGGFVAWRARTGADAYAPATSRPAAASVEVAPEVPGDPEVVEALRALKAADASPGPAQSRALDAALTKLDALVARDPSNIEHVFYRGIAATIARDEAKARDDLALVGTLSPLKERDARFVYLKAIGILTFTPDKPDPALRLLRLLTAEASTFMPEPVRRALHRALVQASITRTEPQRRDEAARLMEEALALVGDDPHLLPSTRRLLALTYARAQRFPEAEDLWRKMVEAAGGRDVDAISGLANTLSMQDRFEEAVVEFTRVLTLLEQGAMYGNAGVPEARLRRGNCYRLLGRLEEARVDLERYVAEHPDDHRGIHWLGMLWFDGYEDAAKAVPFFERAYRAAPWCEVYGTLLLQVYELRILDPERAASLRREMAANADAHKKKMEALGKESRDGISICR